MGDLKGRGVLRVKGVEVVRGDWRVAVLRVGVDGFEGVVGVEGRRRGERKGALMEVVRRRRLGSRSCIEGGVDCRRVVNFRECDRDRRVGMGGSSDRGMKIRISSQGFQHKIP